MTEASKTYKAPIFPGNYIRHVRAMDVCFRVLTVGQLEYGATDVYVFGMWYNQGFTKSWSMGVTQGIYIKIADLKDWEICVDDDLDACLRKCPWAKLGT